jgi:hypothetical protein
MVYVKIGIQQFEAVVSGTVNDIKWNGRESKSITCEMSYTKALELFVNGVLWSIIYQGESYVDKNGETITPEPTEYDNSEYSIAGAITDNRDGTITVKMGKPTEVEALQAQLANAVTEEELEAAYVEGVNSL